MVVKDLGRPLFPPVTKNKPKGHPVADQKTVYSLEFSCLLIALCVLYLLFVGNKLVVFGSVKGGWVYPYLDRLYVDYVRTWTPSIKAILILVPINLFAVYLAQRFLEAHEYRVVIAFLVVGTLSQFYIRSLYPVSMGDIIASDTANSYYSPTLKYGLHEFLSNFTTIRKTLGLHAVGNMPGKTVFFYFLSALTSSPRTMGYLVIAFSNLGALFMYWIVKDLFADKMTGLYSLALFLYLPAKVYFFPLMNTMAPVFILAAFFLLVHYTERRQLFLLPILGFSIYLMFFFDPLPLSTGLIFLALLIGHYGRKGGTLINPFVLVALVAGGFLLAHLVLLIVFSYNAFDSFGCILNEALSFNVDAKRPYDVWAVQDLRSFSLGLGIGPFVLYFLCLFHLGSVLLRRLPGGASRSVSQIAQVLIMPEHLIAVSSFLTLLVLDLAGINRGEVIRLWIFLAVFLLIPAAHFMKQKLNVLAFHVVVAATIMQTVVTVCSVAFIVP